ncbi:hypothetical protein [Chryseolinea soli]|uniref:Uncharacterized protein n=1 Tax=Chryseolinea soli TaxID=2321403 RepID=A0A385SEQ7_9BACT|nr:hypothetical protein [Chryseolinea soli]AYB29689.1 hypothetical protein D4L85_03425 [Chryseolinea soli]
MKNDILLLRWWRSEQELNLATSNKKSMTASDITLLARKILVGIIVTLVPFLILFGGLWLTKNVLNKNRHEGSSVQTTK